MNTTTNPEAGGTQAGGSPSVPKKRVMWLVVGWLGVGCALLYSVVRLAMHWNFFGWLPKADGVAALCGAGIILTLTGIRFLAQATRDLVSQFVSALVSLVLAGFAVAWFLHPEPLGVLRSEPSPWWFRGGCFLALSAPAGFWLWLLWLPDATRPARLRFIAAAACILMMAGAAFDAWYVQRLAEAKANEPKQKHFSDQISEAFAEALKKGGPAPKPDPKAWQRIRVGLSREEVLAILGKPATTTKENPPANSKKASSSKQEWWEYGYSAPIGTIAADPRAYTIYFDDTGHVTSFQEPSEPSK